MGPNRQRRKREPCEKKRPTQKGPKPKAPSLVTSAARDLIADVLHHAASGGSVPVPERHFDSTLGTKITLQRNAPLTTVEILSRVYEGLGFPRDLVTQYVSDLVQSGVFPSFNSVEDLLEVNGAFQPFLVQSCFELFNCITLFKRDDGNEDNGSNASDFDAETADEQLEEELETAVSMFEAQYISRKNFEDDATGEREVYFLMSTEEEKKILVAIRFPDYYPQEPPMIFLQPIRDRILKGTMPSLLVAPKCTKELSAVARRSIIDAAVDVVVSLSGGGNCGCVVPLLSSINGAISALPGESGTPAPIISSPTGPTRSELEKKRKAFLGSLREIQNQNNGVGSGDTETEKPPGLSMPERVELATVAVKENQVNERRARGNFLQRNAELDANLKTAWDKLSRDGSLSANRRKLPAYEAREDLRRALQSSKVVVIGGETGSGKTTQIPQYLYEFSCEEGCGSTANIICTQPRRLAATSVALRVAEERDDAVGGTVGYSIRLENCISNRTQITYCTTGIVLRRLQTDKYLQGVSHVVVDEIHERGVDTDFLLILLRDLLCRRKDLVVVLMSATMDSELFSHYFGGAPVLSIKGRTFPVKVYPLEEIIPLVNYHLEAGSPYEKRMKTVEGGSSQRNSRKQQLNLNFDDIEYEMAELEEQKKTAAKVKGSADTIETLSRMNLDVINYEIIENIVLHIDQVLRVEGAVLVFLPGMAEIQRCMQQLQSNKQLERSCIFYNLHSSLGSSEQQGVFARPPRGKRKIILGTNIMETSITIDDAVYVIDSGKVKENRYNARKCMSELVTVTTSKANCRQRQGRAGRVREGFCFRLFTTAQYEEMESHQLCEMHRVSLDSLILQIYSLNLGDEVEYLQKALSPPEERAIHSSVKVLVTLGALTKEKRLTSLGQHLANLPLDVRVGKMIIHGALLQCIDPVLTMAACLAVRSPFIGAMDLRAEVEGMRRAFTGNHLSDQLASWFAYSKWRSTLHNDGAAAARKLCEQVYLSPNSLSQIQSTKRQYERYLCEAGFLEGVSKRSSASHHFLFPPYVSLTDTVYEAGGAAFNQNSASSLCILACLVAGLYPNVARIKVPRKKPPQAPTFTKKPATRFVTFDGSDCMVHPSSVACKGDASTAQLVVYVDKVKTSDIFLREVSAVSPLHVILFGGGKLEYLAKYKELCVDEVTAFQCEEEEATLLMHFKDQLHSALTTKINDPSKSWESVSHVVVRAIVKLLNDNASTVRGLKVIDRRQPRAAPTEDLIPTDEAGEEGGVEGGYASSRGRSKKTCFHCGEGDHMAKDCPHKLQEKKGGPPVRCFICGSWHFPLFCPAAKPVV